MKLSIEVAGYSDAHDFNGDTHLISSKRLDKWAKGIAELEDRCDKLKAMLDDKMPNIEDMVTKLEEENAKQTTRISDLMLGMNKLLDQLEGK